MTTDAEFRVLIDRVRASQRLLLTTHLNPDGDALGSLMALNSLAGRLGAKHIVMVCQDPVPTYLRFLPGSEAIRLPHELEDQAFDLAISIDASDLERLGDSGPLFMSAGYTIQLDHHRTNERFANHNIVHAELPASGSLMCLLFEHAGLAYTRDEAIWLYTAMSTDTGNFCFGSVDDRTFRDMADLMQAGLPLIETARALHLMREKAHVLLLGRALSSLRFLSGGRLSAMYLSQKDMIDCGAESEHLDRIVNYGLYIPDVRMAYLANEADEGIKFSLRAIAPLEVSRIAAELGGGGHAQAAGCTLALPRDEAIALVEQKLLAALSA